MMTSLKDMMWRPETRGRGVPAASDKDPKPGRNSLSEERILDEALALIDERSLEALTTRALGHRLGVDPTAVYRHFRSKDELVNALADRIMGTGAQPLRQPRRRRQPARRAPQCLSAIRRALLAHPAMTAIVVRRPPCGTNTWAITEQALGLLRSAGFDDGGAAQAYQALLFYTLGHARWLRLRTLPSIRRRPPSS